MHDIQAGMVSARADQVDAKQTLDGITAQGMQTAQTLSQVLSRQDSTTQQLDALPPTIESGFDRLLQSNAATQARSDQQVIRYFRPLLRRIH